MKLIGTCMARDESDVIEAFVRHNLRFLDALVILDHGSVDDTPDILAALGREGLAIEVLRDPVRAFNQGARQTEMARRYLRGTQADFCFALDADEFIRAPSREALEASLGRLPAQAYGALAVQHYLGATHPLESNPLLRLTARLGDDHASGHKVVLRRSFADDPAAQVALGNHAAVRVEQGSARPFAHAIVEGVKLAHFPVRSAEQVATKAIIGWLSHRLTRPERFLGDTQGKVVPASHWRELFDMISSGRVQVGPALLAEATAAYGGPLPPGSAPHALVEDPLGCTFELRYTRPGAASPLATLAAWTDRLVTDVNAARSGGQ